MGSPVLNGRTTFLFLVFLGKKMWARHLGKNCKPDATSCLCPSLGVFLFFRRQRCLVHFNGSEWIRKCFGSWPLAEFLGFSYHFALRPVRSKNVQVKAIISVEWRSPERQREEIMDPVGKSRFHTTGQLSWQCLAHYILCTHKGLLF